MPDLTLLWVVVFLALAFDYINGFHDTANAIATSVSTRALEPQQAVYLAAVLNFLGALYSTGVAKTIGGDIVTSAAMVNEQVIVAALIGAIAWNLLTWWYGIPSSSSHAIIGGVMGAVIASKGIYALKMAGLQKIVLSLILSPLVALIFGYLIMILLLWIFGRNAPNVLNTGFRRMQLVSASLMSFSHGSNDAQKAMGIITLALLSAGQIDVLEVPLWVKLSCAAAMGCGTAVGGWKIIKTMGTKIFRMEPINGFAADLNSFSLASKHHSCCIRVYYGRWFGKAGNSCTLVSGAEYADGLGFNNPAQCFDRRSSVLSSQFYLGGLTFEQ